MTAMSNVIQFRRRDITHWGIDGEVHAGSLDDCPMWECHEHAGLGGGGPEPSSAA